MSINSVKNDTISQDSVVSAQKPVPPTITGYSISGLDDTALDTAGGQTILVNGSGFMRGATITLNSSSIAVVTWVSANQLSFTSPANSAGTYQIYVVNVDGGTAIYIPGIVYSSIPAWTTSQGTLGSYYETIAISNTVTATGDTPMTYSLYSGSLPTDATLNSSTGVISGTAPVTASSTTYSFTIEAIDPQLQSSTRSFSLTINPDVVSWTSPADGTSYSGSVSAAITPITLSASSAAGKSITYTANALPSGVTLSSNTISGTPSAAFAQSTLLTATAATTNRSATRTISWNIATTPGPVADGGTITTYSFYKVHTFTDSGTFTVSATGPTYNTVDILVIGGGGAGGHDQGGGGGAGRVTTATSLALSVGTYTVTIGAGGSQGSGGNSAITGTGIAVYAGGGGKGGGVNGSGVSAVSYNSTLGSGGGAGGRDPSTTSPGTGTFNGGVSASKAGSGGGGAGAVGGNASASSGGNGGAGTSNSLRTGSAVTYAGGGGGGAYKTGTTTYSTGGSGGGGAGMNGNGNLNNSGNVGAANSGSGGGGGSGNYIGYTGANGGSGIVVIRYRVSA